MFSTYDDFSNHMKNILVLVEHPTSDGNVHFTLVKSVDQYGKIKNTGGDFIVPANMANIIKFNFLPVAITLLHNKNGAELYHAKYHIPIDVNGVDVDSLGNAVVNFLSKIEGAINNYSFIMTGRFFKILHQNDVSVKIDCPIDISDITVRISNSLYGR